MWISRYASSDNFRGESSLFHVTPYQAKSCSNFPPCQEFVLSLLESCSYVPPCQALVLSLLVFLLLLSFFVIGVTVILSFREVSWLFSYFYPFFLSLSSLLIVLSGCLNLVDLIFQEQGIGAQLMELVNGLVFISSIHKSSICFFPTLIHQFSG